MKKKPFKPNEQLPCGAKLLRRAVKKHIGTWVPMLYDAQMDRLGLRWYRVKGGFGGTGEREDWVADLAYGCVSVCDYNWNDLGFGTNHGSFEQALVAAVKKGLENAERHANGLREKLSKADEAVRTLKAIRTT